MMNEGKPDELSGAITVKKLLNRNSKILFSIPPYQRGYRWTEKNILALLEDLLEFADSELPAYCLQPIVLQHCKIEKNGKQEDAYRIVDGQQRLTTLTIILKELRGDNEYLSDFIKWDMYYETAEGKQGSEDKKWLLNLLSDSDNDTGINGDFRKRAATAVRTWLEKEERKNKLSSVIAPDSSKDIVFVGYVLNDDEIAKTTDPHDLFDRLNDGKVSLTSAELIRALYQVSTSGLETEDKLEIGKEWELIEQSLHDERLWRVFFRDNSAPFTRIEELFAVVANVPKGSRDIPQKVFHEIEQRVLFKNGCRSSPEDRNQELKQVWQEVVELFWWMRSCAKDVEVANYLGWISLFRDYQLKSIYESFMKGKCLRDSEGQDDEGLMQSDVRQFVRFKKNLLADIAYWIQSDFSNEDIRNGLDKVKYVDGGDWKNAVRLRELFVLLNILACNKAQEYFRFDLYLQEIFNRKGWDVDHIHLRSDEDTIQEEGCDVNGIWNLTLVSAETNRGGDFKKCGSKSFAGKRLRIQSQMQEGGCYIPILSERVYMKFYSKEMQCDDWQYKNDGEPYQYAMAAYLGKFFEEAYGKQTPNGGRK